MTFLTDRRKGSTNSGRMSKHQKIILPCNCKRGGMVTGCMQFAITVIPMGNLHFRNLQKQVSDATLLGDWNNLITLNQESILELDWWITNLKKRNLNRLRPPPITVIITSDASKKGWGGTYFNVLTKKKLKTQGVWTLKESTEQINVLELKGALYTVQALAENVRMTSKKIRMDKIITNMLLLIGDR